MAALLEVCKGWIADGYYNGSIFGRLYLIDGTNKADKVPKASMRPHQDKAQYAKRLGIRFSSKDGQQTSIVFSAGNGAHNVKFTVAAATM